jgi:alpha-amylase
MSNAFQDLRERFKAVGTKLSPESRSAAKQTIQDWSDIHHEALAAKTPGAEFNGTMMQWFHWYIPNDGTHWQKLKAQAKSLADVGITALWLPPAYKGMDGIKDVGYGVYDLFDLGNLTRKEPFAPSTAPKMNMLLPWPPVETWGSMFMPMWCLTTRWQPIMRKSLTLPPRSLIATPWVTAARLSPGQALTFPGRGDKYSKMKWNHWYTLMQWTTTVGIRSSRQSGSSKAKTLKTRLIWK